MRKKFSWLMGIVAATFSLSVTAAPQHANSKMLTVYVYNGCHNTIHVQSIYPDGSIGEDNDVVQSQTIHVSPTNAYTAVLKITDTVTAKVIFNNGVWAGYGVSSKEDRYGECYIG